MAKKPKTVGDVFPEDDGVAGAASPSDNVLGIGSDVVQIPKLKHETITVRVVGTSGLYLHSMSAKARQQLFLGARRKTEADKLQAKHNPYEEFQECMIIRKGLHSYSDIAISAMAFKDAMAISALMVSGIKKTDVRRLVFFPDDLVPVFGVPYLRLDVVRNSGMNRTPDIRTRPFMPTWAAEFKVQFIKPNLSRTTILTLLKNAGLVCGVGDFRQEKGKGSYGTFTTAETIPEELQDVALQREAIARPVPFDDDTRWLLEKFDDDAKGRQ